MKTFDQVESKDVEICQDDVEYDDDDSPELIHTYAAKDSYDLYEDESVISKDKYNTSKQKLAHDSSSTHKPTSSAKSEPNQNANSSPLPCSSLSPTKVKDKAPYANKQDTQQPRMIRYETPNTGTKGNR